MRLPSYGEDEEEDFYAEASREQLLDDDELDAFEAAFMQGYEEAI